MKLPALVRRFEWLMALVICIGLISSILRINEWKDLFGDTWGQKILWGGQAFSILFNIFIAYCITRRNSSTAKWIYTAMTAFGILMIGIGLSSKVNSSKGHALEVLLIVLVQLYMIYLLFTPEFEKWLKRSSAKKPKSLVPYILGATGILFLILGGIWALRLWFEGPIPDSIYTELSQKNLKQSLAAIEFYRQVHGTYPSSLEDLGPAGKKYDLDTFLYDSSHGIKNPLSLTTHQYGVQSEGKNYFLFDVGQDGVSGTADDVYPVLSSDEASHIGYVKK